jgi:hypothetical protein
MNDRDLLILAAKAAGYWAAEFNCPANLPHKNWNPLTDDGDALRLAVKLKMTVDTDYNGGTFAGNADIGIDEPEYGYQEGMGEKDPYAATRRAIVRAAAEIGRSMK